MKNSTNIKGLFYRFFAFSPLPLIMSRKSLTNIGIIMLHGVHDREMEKQSLSLRSSILKSELIKNLKAISRLYSIISLDEAIDILEGKVPWRKRCIVLTFDDSLKCMANIAAPLLAELGLTATFYISTDVIETQKPYWWSRLEYSILNAKNPHRELTIPSGKKYSLEHTSFRRNDFPLKMDLKNLFPTELNETIKYIEEQLGASLLKVKEETIADVLNWDDVKSISNLGMTIGGHTVTHPNLNLLSDDELLNELETSKKLIEHRLGISCDHFAYPTGFHSPKVLKAVQDCGYRSAVTCLTPGWNAKGVDVYKLHRFTMPKVGYKFSYYISDIHEGIQKLKRFGKK
jgi:peptidoglycan/xylan/chitin deacetylase (PgdA/CDA1 family)